MKGLQASVSAVVGVLVLGMVGCGPTVPTGEEDRLRVVSTSTMIGDWVERVGGEAIAHEGLLEPGVDPHIYEPVPQDSVAIENADVIFYNGYDLEPGLIRLVDSVGESAVRVALGEIIPALDFEEDGEIEPDPHVWGDVRHAITMTNHIRDVLSEESPPHDSIFQQNAAMFTAELEDLDDWVREQIATIPENNRLLVTTHDAFQYYANAYGLEVLGTLIGISTEEQPSAQTLRQLVDEVRESGVPVIFAETTINPQLINTVAEEAGVELAERELYSDSIGAPGSDGDSYIRAIAANTCTITDALGGSCTPFGSGR
ncbi:MAG: metal ABC transporter substrate-binding protein [Phormidium sp. GEM2.Bin31]|nr:zinc ABC transporter substrate-binding protein [Phormidium sp. BM_Day4_Bin.17]TVR05386.1 MAG: metal ABC transporter substrate-binding protein [Phormidium sp. GEM2.Bin31]UCJ13945.1 MAG: zinc ABC transporter substrate-binding protein [Phormidium sp. PBR-2020]